MTEFLEILIEEKKIIPLYENIKNKIFQIVYVGLESIF